MKPTMLHELGELLTEEAEIESAAALSAPEQARLEQIRHRIKELTDMAGQAHVEITYSDSDTH